ncbi:hypothetical protein [Enterobacter asburiae]|uniref:hypothetical protein n=1 Tax=Enterobacter asburiae TaxID=61645 RepID=UPI003EBB526E
MAIELSGAYKMIRSHYDEISWSPSKKWKSRTFVADASARKKLLKTISGGIFHQQQKNIIFDLERFPE